MKFVSKAARVVIYRSHANTKRFGALAIRHSLCEHRGNARLAERKIGVRVVQQQRTGACPRGIRSVMRLRTFILLQTVCCGHTTALKLAFDDLIAELKADHLPRSDA